MLCKQKQYFRFTFDIFRQSRRSFTQKRHLEDLKQIYDLLKEETLSNRKLVFMNSKTLNISRSFNNFVL